MSSIWTIQRSAGDAKLAGLCAGVARHWNVDPVLVRVGWALLALSGGVGVVLYLAGWLLLPREGRDKAPVDEVFGEAARRWPRELRVALVVIACVIAFVAFGSVGPFSIVPAIVIAIIWYFGFYRPRHAGPRDRTAARAGWQSPAAGPLPPPAPPRFEPYPGPPTPFTEAAAAWQQRISDQARASARPAPGTWPAPPAAGPVRYDPARYDPARPVGYAPVPPDPAQDPAAHAAFLATPDPVGLYAEVEPATALASPVRRTATPAARRLRLLTLVTLGLTLSALGVVETTGGRVPATAWVAAPLLVVGLALIAATVAGRARGLLPVGILLGIAVLGVTAAQTVPPPTHGSTVQLSYTAVADLPPGGDRLDAGQLAVDLSRLNVTRDVSYTAQVDLGRLVVTVPRDTRVVVNYRVDLGGVVVYGSKVPGGPELTGSRADPADPGSPTLTLNLSADMGNVEVQR